MKPRLFIEQKITAFANKYKVYGANEAGEQADMVAFAQQKRLAFKENVTFYNDENKAAVAFTFRAEKVMDVHGRYMVEDTEGNAVGIFRKEFKKSLLNSTWKVMNANGDEMFVVRESSQALAVLRRFAGMLPIVGDIFDIILIFLKYHFSFIDVASGEEVGKYQKTTLLRDHYTLHMTDEAFARADWRTLAAMGVALDALQSR